MTIPAAIVIRDIETIAEMREVEEVQKKIWGVTDRDVVSALIFRPFREVGAILVGAFAANRSPLRARADFNKVGRRQARI